MMADDVQIPMATPHNRAQSELSKNMSRFTETRVIIQSLY